MEQLHECKYMMPVGVGLFVGFFSSKSLTEQETIYMISGRDHKMI